MRFEARRWQLTALAGLSVLALVGLAPDPNGVPPQAPNPAILDIQFSPDHLRAGGDFAVTIRTTPDVTSLQAYVMKYKLPVPKTGDGIFSASAHVPWWARIYHGTFHVTFVGVDAAGAQAAMEAAVRI